MKMEGDFNNTIVSIFSRKGLAGNWIQGCMTQIPSGHLGTLLKVTVFFGFMDAIALTPSFRSGFGSRRENWLLQHS